MTGYEQLEFEETRNLGRCDATKESKLKCLDNNGNEIKVGDYIVAVSGEAKLNCIEGLLTEIFSDFEPLGNYITRQIFSERVQNFVNIKELEI